MKEIIVDYCPRCGEDHGKVMAQRFKGNFVSAEGRDFQYWGWCPAHLDPIIFSVDDNEELADSRTSEEETKEGLHRPICGCTSECEDSQSCLNETEPVPTD